MAPIPGVVRFTGMVGPTDSLDVYATQSEVYNLGGFRAVANAAGRTGITTERRKIGMLVFQVDTSEYWTLIGGIADINWVLAPFGVPVSIHHKNVGGGTLIAGVPLYDYEDHDKFNTSWCWSMVTEASTFGPTWRLRGDACFDAWNLYSPLGMLTNATQIDVGDNGGPQLDVGIYSSSSDEIVTNHLMVKGFGLDLGPLPGHEVTEFSLAIGFWDEPFGLTPADYPIIVPVAQGIGFAYGTSWPGALFPNVNYYAVSSFGGNLYVEDTGVAIVTVVPHKFNVVFEHHQAMFYIDNVLTNTITQAEATTSWPHNIGLYPSATVANRHTVAQDKQMGMLLDYPLIWSADHVPLGPDP